MPFIARYTTQGAPKNRRAVDPAKSSLSELAPVIQEQYQNALAVNGFSCLLYSRLTSGLVCSCSKGLVKQKNVSIPILDDKGNATEEQINTLLDPTGVSYRINRYGHRGAPEDVIGTNDTHIKTSNELDDVHVDNVEGDIDTLVDFPLESGTANSCGVCFGTTYVGGYRLFGGQRLVLDTQYSDYTLVGFTLRGDLYPHSFEQQIGSAYVEFGVVLPKGSASLDSVRAINNTEALDAATYTITINTIGSTWVELTAQNFLSYCTGTKRKLRVTPTKSLDADKPFSFTHLELQIPLTTDPLFIEYPRLSVSENLAVPFNIDAVSLNVSPLAPEVSIYDIVHDRVFGRYWRITNVQNLMDRHMRVHGWDCQARLVQEYEVFRLLPGRPDRETFTRFARLNQRRDPSGSIY